MNLPCDNHVTLLFSMAHLATLLELHNSSQNANPIAIKTHSSLSVPTHLSWHDVTLIPIPECCRMCQGINRCCHLQQQLWSVPKRPMRLCNMPMDTKMTEKWRIISDTSIWISLELAGALLLFTGRHMDTSSGITSNFVGPIFPLFTKPLKRCLCIPILLHDYDTLATAKMLPLS